MKTFKGFKDLKDAEGQHLGVSQWRVITQEDIDNFAKATGDHQWIHDDAGRATNGPFGATTASDWMSLSLVSGLEEEVFHVEGVSISINYGAERVRFHEPVFVGCKIRLTGDLLEVTERPDGARTLIRLTIEIEGQDRPACVADVVYLYVW